MHTKRPLYLFSCGTSSPMNIADNAKSKPHFVVSVSLLPNMPPITVDKIQLECDAICKPPKNQPKLCYFEHSFLDTAKVSSVIPKEIND